MNRHILTIVMAVTVAIAVPWQCMKAQDEPQSTSDVAYIVQPSAEETSLMQQESDNLAAHKRYASDASNEHYYLTTVADGAWPCLYYLLNYNDDIAVAETKKWYDINEDERDWIEGVGPFSNDENMFFTTEWPSQVRPILIRRHFTLTASDIADINEGTVVFKCSYDENPKVYLNGSILWSASGYNDNDYATKTLTSRQKHRLVEGDNVVAVSLMQGVGGGHIDFGLFLIPAEKPDAIIQVAESKNHSEIDQRLYNLNGQYVGQIDSTLANGIYIQGGQKIIVNKR